MKPLPCPFCGSEGIPCSIRSVVRMYVVECPDMACYGAGRSFDTPKEAIAAWNQRTFVTSNTVYLKRCPPHEYRPAKKPTIVSGFFRVWSPECAFTYEDGSGAIARCSLIKEDHVQDEIYESR